MIISKVNLTLTAKIALAVMIWFTSATVMLSCGKKGPPEPPSGLRPPRVRDLSYGITGNTIKLSWTVPEPDEKAQLPISGFLIFQFQQSLAEKDCPNCPIIFTTIGDVPVRGPGSGGSGRPPLTFTQTIKRGYKYVYKVNGYSEDDIRSQNSNFVEFRF
jgi:hypothetical protein